MPKPNKLFLGILLLAFNPFVFADETLTVTTYYPSPYGVYNELQLYAHNPAVTTCDDAHKGTMFYKSTDDQVYVCKGATLGWQILGGGGAPDYDSGWFADNVSTDHLTTKTHNLGVIPSRIQIWFSPGNPPSNWVYPISVYGMSVSMGLVNQNGYRNPEGIAVNTTTLQYWMYSGDYMYSYWTPTGWIVWVSGYYRVKMWK